MTPIYDFEAVSPPALTEAILRARAEEKRLRRQTALVTLAAVLTQVCLVVLGLVLYPVQPQAALACFIYLCLSTAGGGVVALTYTRKRRFLLS